MDELAIWAEIKRMQRIIDRLKTFDVPASGGGGGGSVGGITAVTEGPGMDVITAGTSVQVGLGGDTILVYDPAGGPASEYAADDAGLTSALAAASSGGVVLLPAVSISGDHAVPAGVSLIGLDLRASILTGPVSLGSGSCLRGLRVAITETDAGDIYGAYSNLAAGQSAYLYECDIVVLNNGAGDASGMLIDGSGFIHAYRTRFSGASPAGVGVGVTFGASTSLLYQYDGVCLGTSVPYSADQAYTSHVQMGVASGEYVHPLVTIEQTYSNAGDPPATGAFITFGPRLMEWTFHTNNWPGYVGFVVTVAGTGALPGVVVAKVKCLDAYSAIQDHIELDSDDKNGVWVPDLKDNDGTWYDMNIGDTQTFTMNRLNDDGTCAFGHGPQMSDGHFVVTELSLGGVIIYSAYGV